MDASLAHHVRSAAGRAEVRDAVGRVYAELQREVDVRRPACSSSGRCCRFEEYGHRLYVTTLELAAFVADLPAQSPGIGRQLPTKKNCLPPPASGGLQHAMVSGAPSSCPFQIAKLCSVHAIRPFGCRMFFCDATSTEWQNERYERFHAELKRLHAALDVPYLYVEWRQALAALGLLHPPMSAVEPAEGRARLSLPQL